MLALGPCDGALIGALRGKNEISVTIPAEKTEPADALPTTVIPPVFPFPPVVVATAAAEYAFLLRLTKLRQSICSPHEVLPPRSIASVRRSRSSCDSEAASGFVNKLYFVFDMNQCMQKPTETSKESKEPEMTVSQMEEAKNAEKFLPPRGSLQVFVVPPGVLGVLAVTHVPQLDAKPSDANDQLNEPQPTPTAEATTPLPALLPRPRFAGRSRKCRVPGSTPRVL